MKQLIIITGLSGSGKSIALRALEDSGYYCIDNLPATMLPNIAAHLSGDHHDLVAISIDSRSAGIETLADHVDGLRKEHIHTKLVFLESDVETLVKRFSETRRKHPLSQQNQTLAESIAAERDLLSPLGALGHVIDTSHLSANTLRGWVKEVVASNQNILTLLITSFGFKHGIPMDADFVFDVRSLPNPHYDPNLQPMTGRDLPVQTFLKDHAMVNDMMHDIQVYLDKWLPSFVMDNRSYLTVAIGCTGGQHRSVYFVETLSQHFKQHYQVLTRHRELD
jgi:UPF0042 nucleotide-binding protein